MNETEPQQSYRRLDQARPGERIRVQAIEGEDALSKRLSSFGFWPDTEVLVVRYAPFGDPIHVRLRGYDLAVRQAEAHRVVIC